jgi:hypothetical protein
MQRRLYFALALGLVTLAPARNAFGDDDNNNLGLQARPSVFIGTAPGCASNPAGSNIVTAEWLTGIGLPDTGSLNITPSTPPNRDPHYGLLLSKNGAAADCSSAGAEIRGAEGLIVTELGFDYRNGGHCGAGSPRFNLLTTDNILHFIGGCANGTKTQAPQNPAEWTRVRFNLSTLAVPALLPGARIKNLTIIFDEGTDTLSADDPFGVGLAVVDNIDVNGVLIQRGSNQPANGNNGNGNGNNGNGNGNNGNGNGNGNNGNGNGNDDDEKDEKEKDKNK